MKKLAVLSAALCLWAAAVAMSFNSARADNATLPTQIAQAAMTPPMAYNWTGFYLGLCGGWGQSKQTGTSGVTSGTYGESGGLVGGRVGFNWQMNNLMPLPVDGVIVGLEGDIAATNINGQQGGVSCPTGCKTDVPWLNTDRARLGVAWDRFFPFITGGLAVGSVPAGQGSCVPPPGATALCGTNTRIGWTVGTGVEAKLAPAWSLKLDYLHIDLGTKQQYVVTIPINV